MWNNLSLLSLLVIASIFDLTQRRIPNLLILLGFGISVTVAGLSDSQTIELALKGTCLVLLLGFPLYQCGWFGAGDIKLIAMVGSFVGVISLLKLIPYMLIAGGVVSGWYRLTSPYQTVPYAVAITCGVIIEKFITSLSMYS